jgi:nucleotide-binding universal stress UspA family protein
MGIVLLHINVIPAPTFEPYTSPLTPQPEEIKVMLADEINYLKITCAKLEQEGLRVTYLLSDGMVAETIVEVAEVEQADLIAMSTHGYVTAAARKCDRTGGSSFKDPSVADPPRWGVRQ